MRKKIRTIPVATIKQLVAPEPATVQENARIEAVLDQMAENPQTRSVYVLNSASRVIGSIRISFIMEYIFPYETFWSHEDYYSYWGIFLKRTARDFMARDFHYVHDDTPVAEMIRIMTAAELQELPVVDHEMKILGEVNVMEAIAYFRTPRGARNEHN